jgi:hypothetical protein
VTPPSNYAPLTPAWFCSLKIIGRAKRAADATILVDQRTGKPAAGALAGSKRDGRLAAEAGERVSDATLAPRGGIAMNDAFGGSFVDLRTQLNGQFGGRVAVALAHRSLKLLEERLQ